MPFYSSQVVPYMSRTMAYGGGGGVPYVPIQQEGVQWGARGSNVLLTAADWGIQGGLFGAELATTAGMGLGAGLVAGVPFMAAGLAATAAIGQMKIGANFQQNVTNYMLRNVRFAGNQPMPTIAQAGQVTQELYSLAGELGTNTQEIAGLMARFNQLGFMRNVQGVRQFRQRLRQLTMAARTVADELGTSLQEAGQVLSQMRQVGFRGMADMRMMMPGINRARWATGLSTQQVLGVAQQGARLAHMMGAQMWQGATGMIRGLGFMAAATNVLPESTIEEATGVMGPQSRVVMAQIMQQALARRLMTRSGRYFLAAAATSDFRSINMGRLADLLSGGYTMDEIRRMARERVYGREGRAVNAADRILMHEEEMRGQLLSRGPQLLAAMLRAEYGTDIYDTENWRVNMRVRRQFGVSKRQADVLLRMARRLPELIEAESREEERRIALQQVIPEPKLTDAVKKYVSLWMDKRIRHPLQRAGAALEVYLEQRTADWAKKIDAEVSKRLGLDRLKHMAPAVMSGGLGAVVMQERLRGRWSPALFTTPATSGASALFSNSVTAGMLWRQAGMANPAEMSALLRSSEVQKQWEDIVYGQAGLMARGSRLKVLGMLSGIEQGPLGQALKGKSMMERMAIVRAMGETYGWGVTGAKGIGLSWVEEMLTGKAARGWAIAPEWTPTAAELRALGMTAKGGLTKLVSGTMGSAFEGGLWARAKRAVRTGVKFAGSFLGTASKFLSPAGSFIEAFGREQPETPYWAKVLAGAGGYEQAGRALLKSEEVKWLENDQELAPLLADVASGDEGAYKNLLKALDERVRAGGDDAKLAEKILNTASKSPLFLKLAAKQVKSDAVVKWVETVEKRVRRWRPDKITYRMLERAGFQNAQEIVANLKTGGTYLTTVENLQERLWEMPREQRQRVIKAFERGGSAAEPITAALRPVAEMAAIWERYSKKGRPITGRKAITAVLGGLGIENLSYLKTKEGRRLLEEATKGSEEAAKKLSERLAEENQLPQEYVEKVVGRVAGGYTKEEMRESARERAIITQTMSVAEYRTKAIKLADNKKLFGSSMGMHAELMKQTKLLTDIKEDMEKSAKTMAKVAKFASVFGNPWGGGDGEGGD